MKNLSSRLSSLRFYPVKGGPPSTQGQEEGIKEEVCGKMLPSLVSGFRTFKEINPDFKGDRRITMILAGTSVCSLPSFSTLNCSPSGDLIGW